MEESFAATSTNHVRRPKTARNIKIPDTVTDEKERKRLYYAQYRKIRREEKKLIAMADDTARAVLQDHVPVVDEELIRRISELVVQRIKKESSEVSQTSEEVGTSTTSDTEPAGVTEEIPTVDG